MIFVKAVLGGVAGAVIMLMVTAVDGPVWLGYALIIIVAFLIGIA